MRKVLHNSHIRQATIIFVVLLCALFPLVSFADGDATIIPSSLEGLIYNMSVGIGGFFLWIAGGLLDYAVTKLVVGMGDYLASGVGVAIDSMWVLVRDMFNVLFIFGLIYIGFRTILFSEDNKTKKTLGLLIIAALMINFSLFITKAIVDVSNATAYQIHQKIISEKQIEAGGFSSVTFYKSETGNGQVAFTKGVSYSFMNTFLMTTYANGDAIKDYSDSTVLGGRLMFFGLMMMFVMLIAAFVFAAGAFLMISRFVGLIIFMILSPAMFLGYIFPAFENYQKAWWNKFLQYAFVAPAYLFMLYLSLFVIKGLGIDENSSFANAFASESIAEGSFVIFLNFFIIAGFLIAALFVAQKMGVYGAAGSMSMLRTTGNYIRGGAQGLVGRNSIGRIGAAYDKRLEEKGVTGTSYRRQLATLGANAKFGSTYSRKQVADAGDKASQMGARRKLLDDTADAIKNGVAAPDGADGDASRIKMERAVGGADTEHLQKTLERYKPDSVEYKAVVANMRSNQFDSLMKLKDEDFSLQNKNTLKSARSNVVKSQTGIPISGIGPVSSDISKADMSQLKILGAETLEQNAGQLKASQIEDIKKSDDFTVTEKSRISKEHEKQLVDKFNTSPESVFKDRKDEDIAKLPKQVLVDPRSLPYLKGGALNSMRKTLTEGERAGIRTAIEGDDTHPAHHWLKHTSQGFEF